MSRKNILAIQMCSKIGDFDENCAKVSSLFSDFYTNYNTSNLKPDIVFLPEVWTLGWYTDCFRAGADRNKNAPGFLASLAKEYDVNIVGGSYIRKTGDGYRNACPVLNRDGEVVTMYDKIHLYSPDGEARAVDAGDRPVIVDIEGLKLGLSICYDIRFPELFRSYMVNENRPDMLVNLSAWPKTRRAQYEAMAKSRAVENQSYFLALSQTGPINDGVYNSGYSMLVGPLGECIFSLNEEEGFIFETVDTQAVDEVRETYPNLENRKVNDFGFRPEYVKMKSKSAV